MDVKNYLSDSISGRYTIITETDEDEEFDGLLYEKFYNKLKDPMNEFFTPEERGLTSSISLADPKVMSRGPQAKEFVDDSVDPIDLVTITQGDTDYYIADENIMQEFFKTFPQRFKERVKQVYDANITTPLNVITDSFIALAKLEARYYVVNDLLQSGASNQTINKSAEMVQKYADLLQEIEDLLATRDENESELGIDKLKEKLEEIPCIKDNLKDLTEDPPEQNIDLKSFPKSVDDFPTDEFPPSMTKACYWVKYATIATVYGLTPLPDIEGKAPGAGFRYWPVGLLIPTPGGIIKIPLPNIWIPVVVISTSMGLIVIFIGLSGIFPAPFVFFVSNTGVKEFIITVRGPSGQIGIGDEKPIKDSIMVSLATLNISGALGELEGLALNQLDNETWDEFLEKNITGPINDAIDKIGKPKLTDLDATKTKITSFKEKVNIAGGKIEDYTEEIDTLIDESIKSIELGLLGIIDKVDLPSFNIPPDVGQTPQESSIKKLIAALKDFSKLKLDLPSIYLTDLREMVIKKCSEAFDDDKLNQDLLNLPNPIELEVPGSVDKLLTFIIDIIEFVLEKIGDDQLLYSKLMIPGVSIINPFQCKDSIEIPPLDITKIAAIAAAAGAFKSALGTLTGDQLISFTGMPTLKPSMILSLITSLIKGLVPAILLPDVDFGDSHLKNIKKQITDQLPKFGIPKIKLVDFLGEPREVNLNTLKDPIKNLISAAMPDIGPLLPFQLEINENSNLGIEGINGNALKAALRDIIIGNINGITAPIETIYNVVKAYQSFRNFENNILDTAMSPGLMTKKLVIAKLLDMGLVQSIKVPADRLLEIAYLILEDLLPPIPYIVVSIACAYGGAELIRNIHPLLYHEELPAWDKLTYDNIIFSVFLDEFCHAGKIYGGFFENYLP